MPTYLISGPKGVINDWRRFKQLETEQRQEQRREMERLIKKLSMTCRSHLDEETDKQKQKELQEKINGKVAWHRGIKMPLKCLIFSVSSFVYMKQIGTLVLSVDMYRFCLVNRNTAVV